MSRLAILGAPRVAQDSPQRRVTAVAVVAVMLIGIAAGFLQWSRTAVDVVAAVRFEVRLAEEHPEAGLREAVISGSGRRIYLHQEAIVTNSDIARAQVVQGNAASTFGVTVAFNADGATKIFRATQGHIGKPLAILIDGEVVLAPVVRSPVTTSANISGTFVKAEADRIVAGILGR